MLVKRPTTIHGLSAVKGQKAESDMKAFKHLFSRSTVEFKC